MADLPRLAVVACGGTIASVRTDGSALASPGLDAAALVAAVPDLAAVAEISARTFSVRPSSHMDLDDVLALRRLILDLLGDDPGLAGVVVTHGTDTLEEVAYGLDLLWDDPRPVVFTGAMRNTALAGADGPANLLAAAVTASTAAARSVGVLVVVNDEIHAARHARKTHTASVGAFTSPGAGPIGFVAEGRAHLNFVPARRPVLAGPPPDLGGVAVALLEHSVGDDGRLFATIGPLGFAGVVIEGLGGGHLSAAAAASPGLAALLAGMPVVLASRTGAGATLGATYRFAGSETDLVERGAVLAGTLDGPKARVLLTLLLAAGAGRDEVACAFALHGQ